MSKITLYDYWRSSAGYRVRIALALKGLAYDRVEVSLIEGAQHSPENRARNPQGLVPALQIDDQLYTQSLAIIDFLDSLTASPRLVPWRVEARAKAMARALLIAADIHPINNLRVLNYLKEELKIDQPARDAWYRHWITEGFTALEQMAPASGFLGGDAPGVADICLVPQMFNARRFDVPLDAYPRLVAIDARASELDAFKDAHPDRFKPV